MNTRRKQDPVYCQIHDFPVADKAMGVIAPIGGIIFVTTKDLLFLGGGMLAPWIKLVVLHFVPPPHLGTHLVCP